MGEVIFGGEGGHEVLLKAGTGHCKMDASGDFLVIGAYPQGETWDICRRAPGMKAVEFPASDPVSGPDGPLVKAWRRA